MRLCVATAIVVALIAVPATAAGTTRFCGTYTYPGPVVLNVFASTGVQCSFAKRHARAVYQRRRCAKGWHYVRRSPNNFCARNGRIYFALRLSTK